MKNMVKYKNCLLFFALVVAITLQCIPISAYTIDGVNDTKRTTLNNEIKNKYSYNAAYYSQSTSKGSFNQITSNNGRDLSLVYGSPFHDNVSWGGFVERRYLGYTKEGGKFDNPYFPWDYGWSGTSLEVMNYVFTPWDDPGVKNKYFIFKNNFSGLYEDGKPLLEDNIRVGLAKYYGGKTGSQLVPTNAVYPLNSAYINKVVYNLEADGKGVELTSGLNWVDVTYVTQPPTLYTYGLGIAYIENSSGSLSYLTITIAPFALVEGKNLTLSNLRNSASKIEKGKEYEATVDIGNYAGQQVNNVDMQFFINDVEVQHTYEDISSDGATVKLKYTVPSTYAGGTYKISAKLNMIESSRVIIGVSPTFPTKPTLRNFSGESWRFYPR